MSELSELLDELYGDVAYARRRAEQEWRDGKTPAEVESYLYRAELHIEEALKLLHSQKKINSSGS